MLEPDPRLLLLPPRHARSRAAHDDVEVHAEDTDGGVIPRAEVDMLLDAKPKVARLAKVLAPQFVLLHFEPALEDLLRLGAPDRDVHRNLFVAPDAKVADGVPSFRRHGCLPRELFEDFGGSGESVAGLSYGDVYKRSSGEGTIEFGRKEATEREARKSTYGLWEMVCAYVLSTSFSIRTSFMVFVGTVFSAYDTHITKLDKNQYLIHTAEERLGGVLRASPS
jgi:hypothetical protein